MALTLPTCPPARQFFPRLVQSRNDLNPAFGGPDAREARLGGRWAFEIELAAMEYDTFMDWCDLEAETDTVVWQIPQPGVTTSGEGTPRVKGAGQSGDSLLVDGITASYAIQKGRWLSVITSGQRYLYCVKTAVTANGSGEALVPVRPLIRFQHADNDVVELATPKIEGLVRSGSVNGAILNRYQRHGGHLKGLSFTITERA
jgi:hypothetical protein